MKLALIIVTAALAVPTSTPRQANVRFWQAQAAAYRPVEMPKTWVMR